MAMRGELMVNRRRHNRQLKRMFTSQWQRYTPKEKPPEDSSLAGGCRQQGQRINAC
jgi:hypothetical protein